MRQLDGQLENYVRMMWAKKGTDLLFAVNVPPMIRLDGDLRPIDNQPDLTEEDVRDFLQQILDPKQRIEMDQNLDVDFALSWQGVARLRGNAFYQRGLPSISLRLIPHYIPTFDELRLPESVRRLAQLPQGLVLFTGPTGSGKSTTMASLIEWVNEHRGGHIITIEDPIEYMHAKKRAVISQREVGLDTPSFDRALRAALREDPDVILVGEMRDPETIAITLTLAETGHLVLSTLHTNDAAQTLDRIVDVFPTDRQAQTRLQLASVLEAVVAQRLVPLARGGQTAAWEVLLGTHAVRNLIREGKTRQLRNIITMSIGDGMQTLEMSLSELVRLGLVRYEMACELSPRPDEIEVPPPVLAQPARR
jgi:twitching motility protein PilT